jgi:lipocalin
VPPAVLDDLLKQAKVLGFATDQLILVKQDRDDA